MSENSDAKDKRPLGITVIAIFAIVISLLLAVSQIVPYALKLSNFNITTNDLIVSFVLVIVLLISGLGLLKRNKWCWGLSIVYLLYVGLREILVGYRATAIESTSHIINLLGWGVVAAILIIVVAVLYYLTRSEIRRWFGIKTGV